MIEAPQSKIEDDIKKLQQAYARVFETNSQFVNMVVEDLKRFCRADQTTFHPDARVHAVLEGRREVYLRINEYARCSYDELKQRIIFRASEEKKHKK